MTALSIMDTRTLGDYFTLLGMVDLIETLAKNDIQHNDTQHNRLNCDTQHR